MPSEALNQIVCFTLIHITGFSLLRIRWWVDPTGASPDEKIDSLEGGLSHTKLFLLHKNDARYITAPRLMRQHTLANWRANLKKPVYDGDVVGDINYKTQIHKRNSP